MCVAAADSTVKHKLRINSHREEKLEREEENCRKEREHGGELYKFLSETLMCRVAATPVPIKEESTKFVVLFYHPPAALGPTLL